ncbi:MAG TPA: glycosyltransferase family 2 protein [Thermoanaerobaculia bacterium]|nr:glycosyltransferase family 2 protein [Thermoanaerobaculia bacterium]
MTPVIDAGEKIAATVTSVRNQDSSLFEYHIVDGGSVDATLDVVRRHAPGVDLISEPDAGVYDAVNKGIARSQGRFVYVLGAGDVLRPGVLANLAGRLENMPPNSVVYGNVYWISQKRVYDGVFSKRDLTTHCICHQAMFIDRSVFELVGTYDLRYPISADWHFNIRCFSDPRVFVQYVDEVVADYEGGGISDTGYDHAFQSDLPGLIRRSFGIGCLLILWRHRMIRRLLGIRLAVQSRVRRMVEKGSR